MKTLIAAALLLALASPAYAVTETCIGRVTRAVTVDGCVLEDPALRKRVLRICPIGSRCRIVGSYGGDAVIESIDSVIRLER